VATVAPLDAAARIEEIARMLGGAKITETTRRHAEEMLGHGGAAAAAKNGKSRAAGRAR
jgi:DNA repair protein RecN (Recombination protein N)